MSHIPVPGAHPPPAPARLPAVASGFFSGVLAAGLGLGVFAVAVLFLWIIHPYPDNELDGALRIAAGLWLLAHGGDLLRTATASGVPAPLGLTPLLTTALPVWLLYRSGGLAVEPADPAERERLPRPGRGDVPRLPPVAAVGWLVAGYCLVGLAALLYTQAGPVRGRPLSVLAALPLVAVPVAAAGAWSALGFPLARGLREWAARKAAYLRTAGRPGADPQQPAGRDEASREGTGRDEAGREETGRREADRLAADLRAVGRWAVYGAAAVLRAVEPFVRRAAGGRRVRGRWRTGAVLAVRAAGAGVLALVAGGGLLLVLSLLWHAPAAGEAFTALTASPSGRLALVLLSLAYLPNAAVWAAAYALTPGFSVGAGTAVAPGGARYGEVPDFPLFAALPEAGGGGAAGWLTAVVPAAAAGTVVLVVARGVEGMSRRRCGILGTAGVAAASAVGAGVAAGVLAAWSGGPLGSHRLADLGPAAWATGVAAFLWTAAVAVPLAPAVRWWQLRDPVTEPRTRRYPGGLGHPGAWAAAVLPAQWAGRVRALTGTVPRQAAPSDPAPSDPAPSGSTPSDPVRPAREERWRGLRKASGGLMAPFRPEHPSEPEFIPRD